MGFRWFVRERARKLGVAGWVGNTPDGAVELQGEGSDAALSQLAAAVQIGPAGALVDRVLTVQSEGVEPLDFPFTARR